MPGKLDGVGAVVTGAGGGIGRATAFELASAGAGVVVFDINPFAAEEAAKQIVDRGGRALAVQGDVTLAADVDRGVKAAVSEFDELAAMVNFAGIHDGFPTCQETTEALWERVLAVNLKGVFLGTRRAIDEMVPQKRGAIVNMSSYAALRAGGGGAAYAASKAGISGFTRQVASEVAPDVRANALAPGYTVTSLGETSAALLGEHQPNTRARRAEFLRAHGSPAERIPLRRGASPEEIAKLALFLSTDDSAYITGQTIVIDGGSSIGNA
jgi:3-oxoacyl-[acyl-carrier protein] reductase